jgi:anti-sigma-K factor RskA
MSDINNILNNDDELNEELLLKYAEGNLSAEERHAIESKMINSSFVNDAVEGLESFKDKKQVQQYIDELNKQLQKQTNQKKQRRSKRKLPNMDWIIAAVVIVIMLCVLAFTVLRLYHTDKEKTKIEKTKN